MNLLKFDQFTIDPERRRLLRAGEPVPLTPKTFDTLLTLVRERGRVVEKSELMQLLWPDTAVEENNLSQQISAARKALGERSDEGRYIRTVPVRLRSGRALVHRGGAGRWWSSSLDRWRCSPVP